MADWSRPFDSAYVWRRVPRSSYEEAGGGYAHSVGLEAGEVSGILGGTITRNCDSETFESASLDCAGPLSVGTDLLRCHLVATFRDGTTEDVVLGTFLASIPSRGIRGAFQTAAAQLDGRLMELAEDAFGAAEVVPKGTDCGSYAQLLCWRRGITTALPFPSTGVSLGTAWALGMGDEEEGDRVLGGVNRLLAQAGMRAASTDEFGRVRLRLPVDYSAAPVWTFREGAGAVMLDEATDERDATGVCNVVKVTYETPEATVTAEAVDHSSEWSVEALGRRKVAEYRYHDGATQAQADAKAQELLDGQLSVVRRVTIRHVWCGARAGDVVALEWPSQGIGGNFLLRTQTIEVGSAGCLCTSELRRFERG